MKSPKVILRIPGAWSNPGELLARLPEGHRLTPDRLILPDGTEIEFFPMPPDDEFPRIFESSCRRPPREEERAIVGRYTVNVGLSGDGGSLDAARTMLRAGAAIIRAGGAGVFIDNSGLAHGGCEWLEMSDDAGGDALSYAFVSLIGGDDLVSTLGMHVLGFPDLVIESEDSEAAEETLIETIRTLATTGRPVGPGHVFVDERGPRRQAIPHTADGHPSDLPMHNPYGRLRLVSMKDIAESN